MFWELIWHLPRTTLLFLVRTWKHRTATFNLSFIICNISLFLFCNTDFMVIVFINILYSYNAIHERDVSSLALEPRHGQNSWKRRVYSTLFQSARSSCLLTMRIPSLLFLISASPYLFKLHNNPNYGCSTFTLDLQKLVFIRISNVKRACYQSDAIEEIEFF